MGHLNGTVGEISFTQRRTRSVTATSGRPTASIAAGGSGSRRRCSASSACSISCFGCTIRRSTTRRIASRCCRRCISSRICCCTSTAARMRQGRSLGHLLGHVRNVVARPLALARFGGRLGRPPHAAQPAAALGRALFADRPLHHRVPRRAVAGSGKPAVPGQRDRSLRHAGAGDRLARQPARRRQRPARLRRAAARLRRHPTRAA